MQAIINSHLYLQTDRLTIKRKNAPTFQVKVATTLKIGRVI